MELTKEVAEATATVNHAQTNEAAKPLNAALQPLRDVKTAQLPLIEELSLDYAKEFAYPRPARKFTAPSSLPYALALLALLSGPQPLEQLQLLVGVYDCDALIAALRQFGLEMPCHQIPELDADDQVRHRTVCVLTKADTRRVNNWIKSSKTEDLAVYANFKRGPQGDY
jgi:hypothetical protein